MGKVIDSNFKGNGLFSCEKVVSCIVVDVTVDEILIMILKIDNIRVSRCWSEAVFMEIYWLVYGFCGYQ